MSKFKAYLWKRRRDWESKIKRGGSASIEKTWVKHGTPEFPKPSSLLDTSDSAHGFYAFHELFLDLTVKGTIIRKGKKLYFKGTIKHRYWDLYRYTDRDAKPFPGLEVEDRDFMLLEKSGKAKDFTVEWFGPEESVEFEITARKSWGGRRTPPKAGYAKKTYGVGRGRGGGALSSLSRRIHAVEVECSSP